MGKAQEDKYDFEVVNGRKIRVRPTEAGQEVDENGYFRRQGNHFTRPFAKQDGTIPGDPETAGSLGRITGEDLYGKPTTAGKGSSQAAPLKAEPYRYRLIWAKGCHWSNRAAIVRQLEGLEDAISVNLAGDAEHEKNLGWEFVYNEDGLDPLTCDQFLSEAYYRADWDYGGRTTVPALIDLKAEGGPAVVNNDYNWLTVYFETAFRPYHRKGAPDLYPKALRKEIDAENLWLFDNINNAVYRCWFSASREGYSQGYRTFYAAMDLLEKRLAKNRFLFGDYVTDSDIRLYVTLARLDIRYTFQLGETKHRLVDYPNLWGYARDLWQIPAFRENTYFADFANPEVNDHGAYRASYNYRFLRQINFEGLWGHPTDRAKLSRDPAHKFLAETDGGSARTDGADVTADANETPADSGNVSKKAGESFSDGGRIEVFKGYPLSQEQAAAFRKDAETYEKIHRIKSWNIEKIAGDTVKDPKDLPAFADDREEQKKAILEYAARVPEQPLLAENQALQTYIRGSVTDTLTTLITAVKLPEFEEAYQVLYAAFDTLEERLKDQRFLLGDFVSLADVDLFVSLVRFDSLYSRQLGATKHRLVDYPNLWGYARDLYQIPAFRRSVDWKKLIASVSYREEKGNYSMNPFYDDVLPSTDIDAIWETETERAYLSSDPTHVFHEIDNRRFDR